jgi:hypothetical protein
MAGIVLLSFGPGIRESGEGVRMRMAAEHGRETVVRCVDIEAQHFHAFQDVVKSVQQQEAGSSSNLTLILRFIAFSTRFPTVWRPGVSAARIDSLETFSSVRRTLHSSEYSPSPFAKLVSQSIVEKNHAEKKQQR